MGVWRAIVSPLRALFRFTQSQPEYAFLYGLLCLVAAWLGRIVFSLIAISLILGALWRMFFSSAKGRP